MKLPEKVLGIMLVALFSIIMNTTVYADAEIPASEFEDENFYNFVMENYDSNGDGVLMESEAQAVTSMLVFGLDIKSFSGIQYFTELMIDFGDAKSKETLKKYISNYHINVFNLNKVDDFSKFKSDLHIIFNMLKYKRNKEALYNYTMENERYFRHISNDSIRALGELLNAKDLFERFIDNNKEEQDMCKALYDLINDSKQEGKEEGREEGAQSERYKLVSSFINGAKRLGYEEEKIKEALLLDYGLSNDEIEKIL